MIIFFCLKDVVLFPEQIGFGNRFFFVGVGMFTSWSHMFYCKSRFWIVLTSFRCCDRQISEPSTATIGGLNYLLVKLGKMMNPIWRLHTLPETNSSALKIGAWETIVSWEGAPPIFRGYISFGECIFSKLVFETSKRWGHAYPKIYTFSVWKWTIYLSISMCQRKQNFLKEQMAR